MSDQSTMHSLPTVAVQKPPTLPSVLVQQVEVDRRLTGIEEGQTGIERVQWYLLIFLIVLDALLGANLAGIAYLIGHLR